MKRSVTLILVCSLLIPFTARSQNEGIKAVANPQPFEESTMYSQIAQDLAMIQEQVTTGGGGATSPSGFSSVTEGMYLEPGWSQGNVMLNDLNVIDNILLRYDIYHQQIQFIRENDTLAFSKPEEVKCFMFDNRKFVYADFQSNGVIGKSYFEILSDGNCKLYLRRTVKYHLGSESESNLTDDLYIRECEYFISKNGGIAQPIRACRKSVLCAFKDKEKQVKDYMDSNNLKMNTCDQLKQVVTFYNSLS